MFFTAINQMMTEGVDLTLVIRKANGQLAVSVLPKSNGLKDEARNQLIPLTLKGFPQELDSGFLQTVARPVQKASGLITNMARFEAQAEKAAAESKAAKEQKGRETREEKEKREKYEKHLKKAEELIAAGNHKEAVTALGQARLHAGPQEQKRIDGMVDEQKKAMNRGSLFELMEEQPTRQPQQSPQQPVASPVQQPPYPQQPQFSRPIAAQVPEGQQQQTVWPRQQPPQRPVQQPVPPQPQYDNRQTLNQQQVPPPPATYMGQQAPHWQQPEPVHNREDILPFYQDVQEGPTYRPEDYEEYPDFPQSMLENHVPHYQTV